MTRIGYTLPLLFTLGCFDLTLPAPPPPPGPGTLQGTLVYAVPARVGLQPAGGARIALINSSLETTSDLETGRFLVAGLTTNTGQVLITFDVDHDGAVDRQKLIDLEVVKAGPGRDIELGDVALGRNATVTGKVLRGDAPLTTGHAGTTVFVPSAPFVTSSADDGSFVLESLPEGPVRLSFFRAGYTLETRELELSSGQEARVSAISLVTAPADEPAESNLSGVVRFDTGAPAAEAHVRAAADGIETSTVADSEGRFTFNALVPGVYQLAIERSDAMSLRIYNVSVGGEDSDIGVLTLTSGESTRVELDGGLTQIDAEAPPILAIVDPPLLDVEPGAVATLKGLRSSGARPLTYHWRQPADGGSTVSFSNNDSTMAGTTAFTAPNVSGQLEVTLEVSDILGRRSMPARALIRVGTKPTARVQTATAIVNQNDLVTLDGAQSLSADGQPLTYRWVQLSGPEVSEIGITDTAVLTFKAPAVAVATPLSVQLIVSTPLGLESVPVRTTFIIRPPAPWSVHIEVTPSSPIEVATAGSLLVELNAVIDNAPAGAAFTYAWSPANNCPLSDGGFNPECGEYGFQLSSTTTAHTELVAPTIDSTVTFFVDVTLGSDVRHATLPVKFVNRRLPSCTLNLSTIALRIYCDKAMVASGTVDAGFSDPLKWQANTHQLIVHLSKPLAPESLMPITVSGLTDEGGNVAPTISTVLSVQPQSGPHYRSAGSSSAEPRPGWLALTGNTFGRYQRKIIGRRVDAANNRMLWSVDTASGGCSETPCVMLDQTFLSAPGTGTKPSGSSVINVGNRAYLALSTDAPASVAEFVPSTQDGTWSELTTPLSFIALGTNGKTLSLIAPLASGLQRHEYEPATFAWRAREIIDALGAYSQASTATLDAQEGLSPVIVATTSSQQVNRFVFTGTSWSLANQTPATSAQARAVSLGANSLVLVRTAAGDLVGTGVDESGAFTVTLATGVTEFDVVPWGLSAIVAYDHDGKVYAALYDRALRELKPIAPSTSTELSWNSEFSPAFLPGNFPRLEVSDDEVGLSWQEQDGAQWRMAGRLIR